MAFPTRATICDLLTLPLTMGVFFSFVGLLIPLKTQTLFLQSTVLVIGLLFSVSTLALGLLLLPKNIELSTLKRITVVGLIAPLGGLLTFAWVGLVVLVSTYSVMYLVPAMIVIAALTFSLRTLTLWVCRTE
ncbi:MAG: hypothetical protein VXZ82_19965 [Planctomycetota bacterium]|nr:hypothetical protein [Planctomycetota bacterium]